MIAVSADRVALPRLNAAGVCRYCLRRECEKQLCIETYAATVWQVCGRCGGTEFVNGHIEPDEASERCSCFEGLTFSLDSGR